MQKYKPLPSQEKLLELFDYKDGDLYWKEKINSSIDLSKPAGSSLSNGYRRIKIEGETYKYHRLIWKYHYGVDPKNQIDHIDGNKLNNCIENLREATNQENSFNRGVQKNNKLGVKGVRKVGDRYRSQIMVKGKKKHLGSFYTLEEAKIVRQKAEEKYFKGFAYKEK